MGTDNSFEILVVPNLFVEKGHFLKQLIIELFVQQHILPEIWNDVEDLKYAVSVVSKSKVVHSDEPRDILFAINVVLDLKFIQI